MRNGFTFSCANRDVDLARKANAVAAETLIKWRRVRVMIRDIAVVGRLCQTPLAFHRNVLQFSAMTKMTRREVARVMGGTAAGLLLPVRSTRAESSEMLLRAVPSAGEKLPVIGLGSWQVFDVDLTPPNEKQLGDILSLFVKLGGRVIDSSPMYGRSEQVIGTLAAKLGLTDKLF